MSTSRSRIDHPWYSVVDVVQNICRRSDLSEQFYNSALKSLALPLQVWVLLNVLQLVISHRKGHGDEVTRLDITLLDSILVGRKISMGYVILQPMLNTPNTRILKHFRVLISEPSHDVPRELGDEVIASLGFVWESGQRVKDRNLANKAREFAPSNDCIFNDVLPLDRLLDLSTSVRSQASPCRSDAPLSSLAGLEDLMQQLLTEVRSISIHQSELQSQFAAFQK